MEGAQGAQGEGGTRVSRSPARKPSPQVAGTRGTRSCFVLPTQSSGDGKKRELATGGPDSKDGFEPQGQGSRERHERPTNGNSLAGSQALSQDGAQISSLEGIIVLSALSAPPCQGLQARDFRAGGQFEEQGGPHTCAERAHNPREGAENIGGLAPPSSQRRRRDYPSHQSGVGAGPCASRKPQESYLRPSRKKILAT